MASLRRAVAIAVITLFAGSAFAQPENTPEYREKLVAMKKYAEAFVAFRQALEKDPKSPALLFNTGLLAYLDGRSKEAIPYWSRLKALDPEDWRLRGKLIQAYEAAGQLKERDAERADLLKLHKETKDPELQKASLYCRDQFSVGAAKLMVFEYYELKGETPVRFSFNLMDADGQSIKARYTLGSYQATNEIAQQVGQIKPGERLFHLDAYKEGERVHETYGFFVGEPSYDSVKAAVQEILQGKRKPQSGTSALPAH